MITLTLSIGILFLAFNTVLDKGWGIYTFIYLLVTAILFISNVVIGLKMYFQKNKNNDNNEISNQIIRKKLKNNWIYLLLISLSIFSTISSIVIMILIEVDKIQALVYFVNSIIFIHVIIMVTSTTLFLKRLYK